MRLITHFLFFPFKGSTKGFFLAFKGYPPLLANTVSKHHLVVLPLQVRPLSFVYLRAAARHRSHGRAKKVETPDEAFL